MFIIYFFWPFPFSLIFGKVENLDNKITIIEAPLGGVPPPKVFGVWTLAIRKGVWKKKAWRFEFS